MRDLEGVTVVTREQAVAAPCASGRLAEAGARVAALGHGESRETSREEAVAAGRREIVIRRESAEAGLTERLRMIDHNRRLARDCSRAFATRDAAWLGPTSCPAMSAATRPCPSRWSGRRAS